MREYLVGEQRYRRSEWDSATAAFARAIDQDSTFALAHFRLAATIGWSGGLTAKRGLDAIDAALRFAGRLPPRERSLVTAYNLFFHQKLAATDSARAYVVKYPEDVDGWFLLGETQYHTRQLVGYEPAALRAPFDSVLVRDSTLTPAAIHPLEVAIQMRDQTGYERYLKVLESSGNPQENLAYQGAGALVFLPGTTDSTTAAAMLRYGGAFGTVLGGLYSGNATGDSVAARFDQVNRQLGRWLPSQMQQQLLGGDGITLAGLGRFTQAQTVFDSLFKVNPDQAYGLLLLPEMLGFAPAGYQSAALTKLLGAPRKNPYMVYVTALLALNRGDRVEGARLADSMLAHETPTESPQFRALIRATRGWTTMMAGDTAAGLRTMRTALEDVGSGWNPFLTAPLRLQLAAALAQRPATRQEGRLLLQYGFVTDVGVQPMAQYALGRAAELAGDRAGAAEAYDNFLKLWDKADPSLQPRVTEVREALKRVTGEPKVP